RRLGGGREPRDPRLVLFDRRRAGEGSRRDGAQRGGSGTAKELVPMAMRFLLPLAFGSLIATGSVSAGATDLTVTLVAIASPVHPGGVVTLTVRTAPGATCQGSRQGHFSNDYTIVLPPVTAASDGTASWRWRVLSGRHPIGARGVSEARIVAGQGLRRRGDEQAVALDTEKTDLLGADPGRVPGDVHVGDEFVALDAIGAGISEHVAEQRCRVGVGALRLGAGRDDPDHASLRRQHNDAVGMRAINIDALAGVVEDELHRHQRPDAEGIVAVGHHLSANFEPPGHQDTKYHKIFHTGENRYPRSHTSMDPDFRRGGANSYFLAPWRLGG